MVYYLLIMQRKVIVIGLFFLILVQGFSQDSSNIQLSKAMDSLASSYYEDQVQTAFGTFTYEYTELATPFSRWWEDELTRVIPHTEHLRLFNRSAAAAMDPAFRELYADFFATNQVDALLSGRFFQEGSGIRIRMDLTSLRNGNLIGSGEFRIPFSEVPQNIAIIPSPEAARTAQALSGLLGTGTNSAKPDIDALKLSLSTERGPGGAYRDGECLTVSVMVDQDAYVKLYHVDVEGKTQLIWPNRFAGGDGKLKALSMITIPGSSDPFQFRLGKPYGTEFIKAIASTEAFTDIETDFQDLGSDSRGLITRGLNIVTGATGKTAQRAEALASYIILQ